MTPVFCCGAECAVGAVDVNATGHWTGFINGTFPSIERSIVNPGGGGASFHWPATVSTQSQIGRIIAQNTVSVRFYLYYGAAATTTFVIAELVNASGRSFLKLSAGGSGIASLYVRQGASAGDVLVGTFAIGTWNRVDWKVDASGATAISTVSLNGATAVTDSVAQATANFTQLLIGSNTEAVSGTSHSLYIDDIVIAAFADYPIGDGRVQGYMPKPVSGTHLQTAGDFKDDASVNITSGDQSGLKLRESPADTTSFIQEVALGTAGGYVEYPYDTPSGVIPRAVEQIVAVRNVSLTTANNQKAQLHDGTTAADAYALTSIAATTLVRYSKQWAAPPSGGAWTAAQFAAAKLRWGFSTDIVPVPALSWSILEAEVPASLSVPYVNPMPQLLVQ